MKRYFCAIAIAALLVACGDSKAPAQVALSAAQQLVVLDAGGPVPSKEETITRGYQAILDDLTSKFPGLSDHDIADQVVRCQGALAKHSIKVDFFDILSGLNQTVPAGMNNLAFNDLLLTYTSLREKGLGHDESIASLGQFLEKTNAMKPRA